MAESLIGMGRNQHSIIALSWRIMNTDPLEYLKLAG